MPPSGVRLLGCGARRGSPHNPARAARHRWRASLPGRFLRPRGHGPDDAALGRLPGFRHELGCRSARSSSGSAQVYPPTSGSTTRWCGGFRRARKGILAAGPGGGPTRPAGPAASGGRAGFEAPGRCSGCGPWGDHCTTLVSIAGAMGSCLRVWPTPGLPDRARHARPPSTERRAPRRSAHLAGRDPARRGRCSGSAAVSSWSHSSNARLPRRSLVAGMAVAQRGTGLGDAEQECANGSRQVHHDRSHRY